MKEKSEQSETRNVALPIRCSCWNGLCVSCRVQLVCGSFAEQLTDGGYVLSCWSRLAGDAHVIVSY